MNERVVTQRHDEWPERLAELGPHDPPSLLYVSGLTIPTDPPSVAIVGSRRPTAAGVEAAERIARGLSEAGFPVVSGLAVGIDTAAHRAAMDAGGHTVAVLGCGLDVMYPKVNARLKDRIATVGTVLTEYPAGTPPQAHNFPRRNRIIAGLSAAVVFVEGGLKSGGLITARIAVDANRLVFAVPGSIRNVMAAGPNELIRTCQATLITDVGHIFEELAPSLVWHAPLNREARKAKLTLGDDELAILSHLDDIPVAPDLVSKRLELSPGAVALAMARLEVRGFAVRRMGGYALTQSGASVRA